jgi:hypothetical protein
MTLSEAYARFHEEFFGSGQRDGPNASVLNDLSIQDRERAEQELLDHLPSRNAMHGLAYLLSRRAVEPLRKLARGRRPRNVHAAIALWTIRPDAEALSVMCRSVTERPRFGKRHERTDAAAKLRLIRRREAIEALLTALDDRDTVVRANAGLGVKEQLRLNAEDDAMTSGYVTLREYRALAADALDREFPHVEHFSVPTSTPSPGSASASPG